MQPDDPEILADAERDERTADNNVAIRLHHNGAHAGITRVRIEIRVKAGIETPVRVMPRDSIAMSHENPAIRLEGQRADKIVNAVSQIEAAVAAAIRIETGHRGTCQSTDHDEISADDHLPVRLERDCSHRSVNARARVKGRVHIARRSVRAGNENAALQKNTGDGRE
jgi:hypothetical protein